MEFSYVGFTQVAGVRQFQFEYQIAASPEVHALRRTLQLAVSAEMSLFLQHKIPIQDGPAICRRVLIDATTGISAADIVSGAYSLQEADLKSLAATRLAAAQAKTFRRHKPPKARPDSPGEGVYFAGRS